MNIGSVLSCTPHIVGNIFQHLTAKDLSSCASVCSLWAVLSQEEIRRRKGIVPFFQGITCGKHRQIHRTHQECPMRQASKFESELKEQLQNVNIKPAFCIAFATSALLEHFEQLFPAYFDGKQQPRKRLKKCYWDYFDTAVKIALRKHLPPTCCISLYLQINLAFYGGDSQSSLVTTNTPAICGYLFPNFPDGELKFYKRKESVGPILKHIIKNGHNIKGTLNLVEFTCMPYFQIALNELRHKYDAFASGIIMPVPMASNYIPVFEGPNVQVFRFAIGKHDIHLSYTMEHWKQKMNKKKGFTDYTITFMFSIEHSNCHTVCEVFKTVFPGVPLIGLFQCTSLNFRFVQDQASDNFFDSLISRSVIESGLMCQCVFIFVTFYA